MTIIGEQDTYSIVKGEQMSYDFKIVPDKYYRKNGRWAKVCRMHKVVADQPSMCGPVPIWKPYWYVAIGRTGEFTAREGMNFSCSKDAHSVARGYVNNEI